MADVEIVGSHLKSQRGRGQNQDQTGSSTREKSLAPIPSVSVLNANPVNANAKDDDARLAAISGTVPAATVRRDSGKRLLK